MISDNDEEEAEQEEEEEEYIGPGAVLGDGEPREVLDLSGDSGVVKEILKVAKDKDAPKPTLISTPFAEVMYEGRLLVEGAVGAAKYRGFKFDSSYDTNIPYIAEIGSGKLIKAWEMVLPTMQVGERTRLISKAEYAYGSSGSPPDIPPDATLVFDMEVIGVRTSRSSATIVSSKHTTEHSYGGDENVARLAKLREGRAQELARRQTAAEKKEAARKLAQDRLANKGEKKGGGKSKKKKK